MIRAMKTFRAVAALAFILGLTACHSTRNTFTDEELRDARESNAKVRDYVKSNAEKAFDELAAEDPVGPAWANAAKSVAARDAFKPKADTAIALLDERNRASDRAARPDFAWLIGVWSGTTTTFSHGEPHRDPWEYALTASLSSGAVVLEDVPGRVLLRASGPGDAPRWETWRRGSTERPAECPLSEGWEPATVKLSSDRRKLTFVYPHYPKKRCDDFFKFSWNIELSAVPVTKSPTPSEIAAAERVLREYVKLSAETNFDVVTAEESEPDAIDRYIAKWKETVSTTINGKPLGLSYGAIAVTAAREAGYVVFKDHRQATLRVTGSGATRTWEVWRPNHPKRPAECPLAEGWEPVKVEVSSDHRLLAYDQVIHSEERCGDGSVIDHKELRR